MPWEDDREMTDGHVIVDPLVLALLCDQVGRRQHRLRRGAPPLRERALPRWSLGDRDKPSLN